MSLPNSLRQFKVAAVQAAPVFLDRAATVDKALGLIQDAAKNGAALIAFPECWIPGYPWYIWLDSTAWGMRFVQRYAANGLELNSPDMARLQAAAEANNIHVALGFTEKSGGSLYIAQAILYPDGSPMWARRKLKPTHMERTVFGEGHGSDLSVRETALGRIGMLCCWEHLQPLSKYALYAQNEELHIGAWPSFSLYEDVANALGPTVNTSASLVYAVEGQSFVVAPCATISDDMVEVLCDTPEKRKLIRAGGGHARIFGPDGRLISNILAEDEEGLIYADIDLDLIAYSKATADPAGHYSRPDATRLLLNRAPMRPMEYVRLDYEVPAATGPDLSTKGREDYSNAATE